MNVSLSYRRIVSLNIPKFVFALIHWLYYEDTVEGAGELHSFADF